MNATITYVTPQPGTFVQDGDHNAQVVLLRICDHFNGGMVIEAVNAYGISFDISKHPLQDADGRIL